MISTKNLYLVEISFIESVEHRYANNKLYFNQYKKYTLAKKVKDKYVDIFTGTSYYHASFYKSRGYDCVTGASAIVSNKNRISDEEAVNILRQMNPTYITNDSKKLIKK